MLTEKRKNDIKEMVGVWSHDEAMKEEYPSDIDFGTIYELLDIFADPSNPRHLSQNQVRLLFRACWEMNISLDELIEWYPEDTKRIEEAL